MEIHFEYILPTKNKLNCFLHNCYIFAAQNFSGPNLLPKLFLAPNSRNKNFQGPSLPGPDLPEPNLLGPNMPGPIYLKKCPMPDLPRILRIVRPFACLSVLKTFSISFFSSSFAFFGQSCQRHPPHHPLTNITPDCDFYFRLAFGWV